MIANLPILIILCPLIGALISPLISAFHKKASGYVMMILISAAFVMSIFQMKEIVKKGEIHYWFGNWKPPFGIEFSLDAINGIIVCLICFMGALSVIYSMPFLENKSKYKNGGYFSVLALLITGLLGMTSTGDVFNLYVFLEITSLSGYALIALGGDKGVISAFRYLLIGTIGASFYLLGVAFLYGETGTLNMADMANWIRPILGSGTTLTAMALFIVGFGIKMALFPLHGWQPAAYTNAHPGAAPLIAGVMGKVPAYAMLRFFFFVFNSNSDYVSNFLILVGIMSSMGIIYGSIKAIQQKDIRKILAYSSIAQIGYVGMGIAIGNLYGIIGAILHIINHSFMKSGLFFCIGGLQYKYKIKSINKLGQLYRRMPKTVAVIVVAALSMIGIPPTSGFFSKWYLALGAASSGEYIYIAVLIISSLLNAVYFFRIIENIFMDEDLEPKEVHPLEKRELPWKLMVPIVLCGIGIVVLGLFNTSFVELLKSAIMEVV